ncbi:erythromycin esterase family protein [Nocardia cyriacigeorgica]|uniref:Erythromycin esterase family protein n=1 Tax=Nocardia cyriacigeorgica TaxID=135487 RepID=A0ABX0CG89_9NOCA|nr:erythromycin esterase family protein [Nocardia cyriacigeorgica]NEW40445.1 erythromycin esterase family protein [Nocardia cyriacigeorgica]NEW51760.1 erythromycin esterase family protein [Nocardia cyriacigeorgica]NEW55570.1 erythromycin esterase family protein [Nocardia cyriacigeorgica]
MSTATSLREFGRQLDDAASLGQAVDELLAARAEPTALLALGEPTHGIAAFPLLRNELLAHLVERGYRSIVLEIDMFAASVVDDYVNGADTEIDTVLSTGFSHHFGAIPGNRELVEWLRAHNADRAPQDRVRFHGFDSPGDQTDIPSPRPALSAVADYLPAALRPESARNLDALLGEDADWTNPAAMYDPTASIGTSDRARALRIVADDLASALRRAAPSLRPADPTGYDLARAHARCALGLLRYHAAMASPGPDRIATLLSLRAEMMAENLLAIRAEEQQRGPSLVFAHNVHLQSAQSMMSVGGDVSWCGAGALVGLTLGESYVFVATDANPHSEPGTFQGVLAEATTARRALFPAQHLRAALDPSIGTGEPIVPGHIPFGPSNLDGAAAVIFVADTDGQRVQYWQ